MLDVAMSIIFIYFYFLFIGAAPTALIFGSTIGYEIILGIAPIVGLATTTIVGTYLVLLDYPVSVWAFPWLLISLMLSACLGFIAIKKRTLIKVDNKSTLFYFILGFLLTTAMLIAPMLLGGLNFTVLRGNGTDSFNYISMAGYLLHEPYWSAFHSTPNILINKNFSYEFMPEFLQTRWSTSMLLAWFAAISKIPLYRLEYGFTLLFFMLDYGVSYIFARKLQIPKTYALLVAISICAGFWGQFVLDIRAMSHISAIPLAILFAYIFAELELDLTPSWKLQVLLGLLFASIVFLYIEIIPTIILGVLIFITIQFIHKRYTIKRLFECWIAVTASLLAILPASKHLINFFISQVTGTLDGKNNWHEAYFSWLYHYPLTGFWGMNYAHALSSLGIKVFLAILAIFLSVFLVISLVNTLFTKKAPQIPLLISSSLFLATLGEFVSLMSLDQFWAAGKMFSYGYPFMIFSLVAGVFMPCQNSQCKYSKALLKLGYLSVSAWLAIQCAQGIFRAKFIADNLIYPVPISGHGEYRQHDWNLTDFSIALKLNQCHALAIDIPNIWMTEYLNFVFSWDIHTVNINGIKNRFGDSVGRQSMIPYPNCILLSKTTSLKHKYYQIIAQNSELLLLKFHKHEPTN